MMNLINTESMLQTAPGLDWSGLHARLTAAYFAGQALAAEYGTGFADSGTGDASFAPDAVPVIVRNRKSLTPVNRNVSANRKELCAINAASPVQYHLAIEAHND